VDGHIFLRTSFQPGELRQIEVDQRREICVREYRQHLQPFLAAPGGDIYKPMNNPTNKLELHWGEPMGREDIKQLKTELDRMLLP
jgi:hypothetical protein